MSTQPTADHDGAPDKPATAPPESLTEPILEELGQEECFSLLASRQFGRLAVVRDGRPEIFPVNYLLSGRTVVIRTQQGVKLAHASLSRVAFEVDDIDPATRVGWTVEVKGVAEDITDGADPWSEQALQAPVDPWVPGPHDRTVAISQPTVSGRRLHRPST
jgi:hypothetical protein